MATSRLYYDPAKVSASSTLKKLQAAAKTKKKNVGKMNAWLEKQDAYTLHRPVKKRFARNPYNDKYVYILSVIDVFSKFLRLVPLKSKTGTAESSAFQSIFKDPRYSTRRPIWLRTDKGKEFLNRDFQDMLKGEGIQFQVCKNPNVKCSVVEGARRTIRERLYKYFTNKFRTDI